MKISNTSEFERVIDILLMWECTDSQIESIIGLNQNLLKDHHPITNNIILSPEQESRIEYILMMDTDLSMVFSNSKNIYGFMRMKNSNVYFEGRTPLSIIETGSLKHLEEVATRIHALVIR